MAGDEGSDRWGPLVEAQGRVDLQQAYLTGYQRSWWHLAPWLLLRPYTFTAHTMWSWARPYHQGHSVEVRLRQ